MNQDDHELRCLLATDLAQFFWKVPQLYYKRLYYFILRLTGNREDTEDIVQETLLGAYISLKHYSTERIYALELRPWLYKVAYNNFCNYLRYKDHSIVTLELVNEQHLFYEDEAYEYIEQRAELERYLEHLPTHYRIVVICYFFEGMTYQEIADLLDQASGTVKSRMHRALQLLRVRMQVEQRSDSDGIRRETDRNENIPRTGQQRDIC